MNNRIVKPLLTNALVLLTSGFAAPATAHTQDGSLPAQSNLYDLYQVTCGTATANLEAQVRNLSKSGPLLSVLVQNGNQSATATDPTSGDSAYSPLIGVAGGEGQYQITVSKSGSGALAYSLEFHCKNPQDHTETDIVTIKNDAASSGGDEQTEAEAPSIADQGAEGVTLYTSLSIPAGCLAAGSSKANPVIGQSILFPTVNPSVTRSDSGAAIALDQVLDGKSTLANLPQLIQDKSIFTVRSEKTDSNGNVIGFNNSKGKLDASLIGLTPFRFGGITFQSASCAKRLLVNVAVADICKTTFPPQSGSANVWIPATTSRFTDIIGKTPTLIINRNLVSNPLDEACGEGFDVTVSPSTEDIDANLPISKYWSK